MPAGSMPGTLQGCVLFVVLIIDNIISNIVITSVGNTQHGDDCHGSAGGNGVFAARAFNKTAGILANYPKKVESGKELKSVQGIGKGSMDKVRQSKHPGLQRSNAVPMQSMPHQLQCMAHALSTTLSVSHVIREQQYDKPCPSCAVDTNKQDQNRCTSPSAHA